MAKVKKSGWLTIVVAAVAVASYLVYHYAYLVYQEYTYVTAYEDVHGLQVSSPIFLNGVRVGSVENIDLHTNDKVTVLLAIDKETEVPQGTKAMLVSTGLLGKKMIQLDVSNSPTLLTHNDTILGQYDTSVLEMQDQVAPLVESAKYFISTTGKNLTDMKQQFRNGMGKELEKDIKSIETSTRDYEKQSRKIRESSARILSSLNKLKVKSDEIVANTDDINASIKSTEESTAEFAAKDIKGSIESLNTSISSATQKAQEATAPETAVGKLLNEKETYTEPTKTFKQLNEDLKEVKEDPPGISLIGG